MGVTCRLCLRLSVQGEFAATTSALYRTQTDVAISLVEGQLPGVLQVPLWQSNFIP